MSTWNGKHCQLCGRFATHFFGLGEDDGSTTYVDERCLTPAERGYFHLAANLNSQSTGGGERR